MLYTKEAAEKLVEFLSQAGNLPAAAGVHDAVSACLYHDGPEVRGRAGGMARKGRQAGRQMAWQARQDNRQDRQTDGNHGMAIMAWKSCGSSPTGIACLFDGQTMSSKMGRCPMGPVGRPRRAKLKKYGIHLIEYN